jgi:hypothetical protein
VPVSCLATIFDLQEVEKTFSTLILSVQSVESVGVSNPRALSDDVDKVSEASPVLAISFYGTREEKNVYESSEMTNHVPKDLIHGALRIDLDALVLVCIFFNDWE